MPWFRGNLHTHTTNSDGDSAPDEVVAWYRDAGYDFLALTDHDLLTLPQDHAAAASPMLLVHGEEVTAGDVHVNGLGIRSTIAPVIGATVAETLQRSVDAVLADGGMASVNHPNYRWQIGPADLIALRGCRLLEVFNGGPETNNAGGAGRPSHDALWDAVLSADRRMHAIAVDDAHNFKVFGRPYSNPGRGWVHIRAARLTEATVLEALSNGDFYASSGVELADVSSRTTRAGHRHRAAVRPVSTARPSSAVVARSLTSWTGSRPGMPPAAARATSVPASTTRTASLPGCSRSSWAELRRPSRPCAARPVVARPADWHGSM